MGASGNYEPVSNIPDVMAPSERRDGYVVGHIIYDGPVHIYDSYFTGFSRSKFSLFDQWGATIRFTGHSMTNTKVSSSSYQVHFREVQDGAGNDLQSFWFGGMIYDMDGDFTGRSMNAITRDADILKEPSSPIIKFGLNAIESRRRYCYVELRSSDEDYTVVRKRRQTSTLHRSDGAVFTELHDHATLDGVCMPVMVNGVYDYSYEYTQSIPAISRFDYHSMNANEYFILEIPNVPSTAKVYKGSPRGNYGVNGSLSSIPKLSSVSALKSYNGSAYTHVGNSIYIRYQAPAGANFRSSAILGSLFVCLFNDCFEGGNIPLNSARKTNDNLAKVTHSTKLIYPNPVQKTLTLSLKLHHSEKVTLKLYDLMGTLKTTLIQTTLKAGKQSLDADLQHLPAGTYIYHLQVGDQLHKGRIVKK